MTLQLMVSNLLRRELRALSRELEAYTIESDIWKVPPGISNSAGTLALHLAGNLRHYVGARLGQTGYVRDREAEFRRRDVPRNQLLAELELARQDVQDTLSRLPQSVLDSPYPDRINNLRVNTCEWLLALVSHLAYHLGQVDYHRRLVTRSGKTADTVKVAELLSAE